MKTILKLLLISTFVYLTSCTSSYNASTYYEDDIYYSSTSTTPIDNSSVDSSGFLLEEGQDYTNLENETDYYVYNRYYNYDDNYDYYYSIKEFLDLFCTLFQFSFLLYVVEQRGVHQI